MNKSLTLSILSFLLIFIFVPAKSQSLLWEVSGNGLEKSSYLYGTIHLNDQRVFNFNDSVFAKIDECEAFTMEVEDTPENKQKISGNILLEDGQTLDQLLSKEDYAYLKKQFQEKLELNIDGLKIFTPMTIAVMVMDRLFSKEMDTYVDNFLYQYAKSKRKKTFSVEPVQLQMDLFNSVPAEYLIDFIDEWDIYPKNNELMIQAYAKEDLKGLTEIMFSYDSFKQMEDDFIWKRNKSMADSIDLFVNRQSTFIAIGCGHLPLEGGVIDLLQKKGYSVHPIIAPHTKELPVITKNENWVTVAPENGGFSIQMPVQPKFKEFEKTGTRGNLKGKIYMAEMPDDHENLIYGIFTTDYSFDDINSTTMSKKELDDFYEESLAGAISAVNGKVLSRNEIQLDSYTATTADVSVHGGIFNIKYVLLLKKNRLFILQIASKDLSENNNGLKKFLGSFEFKDYDLNEDFKTPSKKEWQTLVSEEGNFSISMLGKTIGRRNHNENEAPKNSDPVYYSSENIDEEGNHFVLYVQYENFPPENHSDSVSTEKIETLYDNILSNIAIDETRKIVSQKKIKIEGHLARKVEFEFLQQDYKFHVNIILLWYKDKNYLIQHLTQGKKSPPEEIDNFFNSFKILKK